jgi:XkdW protein
MDYFKAIKHLYPEAEVRKDFTLRDDGEGVFIDQWNLAEPQPILEKLNAAWEEIKGIPVEVPKTQMDILGEQLVEKDIQIMELQSLNDTLGNQVVDHDIRLMMGGL